MKTIRAVYEKGVFRPLEPVDLPEHSRVSVAAESGAAHKATTAADLEKFRGSVSWPEDPMAYQRRIRDEWPE